MQTVTCIDRKIAYQAPFSHDVKKIVGDKLLVGAVGSITTGKVAQEILDKGQADVVFAGRWFQKNPGMFCVILSAGILTDNVTSSQDWC